MIVLVTGVPGTGKTTLASRLSHDLGMPSVGKDQIKEFLYDTLVTADTIPNSKVLGAVSFDTLYTLIAQYVESKEDLIVDCPFHAAYARPKFQELIADKRDLLEVHLTLPESVLVDRFNGRMHTGQRHTVHHAGDVGSEIPYKELQAKYGALGFGKVVSCPTENFGDSEYTELLRNIKKHLETHYA